MLYCEREKLELTLTLATFKPEPAGGSPKPSVYKLPQTFHYGQCALTLDIDQSVQRVRDEQSTWTNIGLAATQLISACSQNGGMTGGWTRGGDADKLMIYITNTASVPSNDFGVSNIAIE